MLTRARWERDKKKEFLSNLRRYHEQVRSRIERHRTVSAKLNRLATHQCPQARTMLASKINEAQHYLAIREEENVAMAGGLGLPGSGPDYRTGEGVRESLHCAESQPALWHERGIQDVKLYELPEVEGISGPGDFQKVPMEEMKAGLKRYNEIKRMVDSGKGKSKDYWAEVDRQRGLTYSNGYQRIYEAFWGMEPIRLTRDGNTYTIENGRHRIWLARQMGIDVLPASIVERAHQ